MEERHCLSVKPDIVINELNDRFYWDSTEQVLSYATPTEIIHARGDMRYEDELVFIIEDETVWVNLSYVEAYTNIQVDTYANPDRVFIRSYWGETTTARGGQGRYDHPYHGIREEPCPFF